MFVSLIMICLIGLGSRLRAMPLCPFRDVMSLLLLLTLWVMRVLSILSLGAWVLVRLLCSWVLLLILRLRSLRVSVVGRVGRLWLLCLIM